MPDTSEHLESLFAAATELSAEKRSEFVAEACGDNVELRERLEGLLRAHDATNHPIDQLAVEHVLEVTQAAGPSAVGSVVAGRYKLLEQIGEGGMGTVWVAEQSEPVTRKVALKLIKPGMDSKAVLARFEAERQALAMMDHPNIAKVLDGGLTDSGRPYFVMEYVKGVPITEYCDQIRMNVADRMQLFVQVCSAVQHAHQKGIIHRDLKPSNILVAPYDDRPVPKVIDFGLAKAMHQRLTERTLHTAHETVIGTPLYMSPEQAQLNNLDVDTRSDVYSLGVLLYELLTGTTPLEKARFKEAAWDEIRRIIGEEEPPRPSTRLSATNTLPSLAACRQAEPVKLTQQLRGDLDWIAMKALEKDRTRRYETATELAKDVERFLAGDAVEACPPTLGYRLKKFAARHRTQVMVASALVVALLIGVAGTTFGLIRANEGRRLAIEGREEAIAAREQETRQRERAEAVIDRTLGLLDSVTSSSFGTSMTKQASLTPDQERFYKEVLNYYEDLSNQHGEDRRTLERYAEAALRVAELNNELGDYDQAAVNFERAASKFQDLAARFDNAPELRARVANSYIELGALLCTTGEVERSEITAAKTIEIYEALVSESPQDPELQHGLARSYELMCRCLYYQQQIDEAASFLDKALSIQEPLARQHPEEPEYGKLLAHLQIGRGVVTSWGGFGSYEQADSWFKDSLATSRFLVANHPENPYLREHLAKNLLYIRTDYLIKGRLSEAEKVGEEAIMLSQQAADEFPGVPHFRTTLASALMERAMGKWYRADDEVAEGFANRALRIAEELSAEVPNDDFIADRLGTVYTILARIRLEQASDIQGRQQSLDWSERAVVVSETAYAKEQWAGPALCLCNALLMRARVYETLEVYEKAEADWRRLAEIAFPHVAADRHPSIIALKLQAGELNLEDALRQVAEFKITAEGKVMYVGRTIMDRYFVARLYCIAARLFPDRRDEFEDRAIEMLRPEPRDAKVFYRMARQHEFAALRQRPELQEILGRIGLEVEDVSK